MSTFTKVRNYELPPGTYTAHVVSASWVPQAQDKPLKIQLVFQVVDDPEYQCQRIGLHLTLHEKGMPFARRCFAAVGVPSGTRARDIPTMQFRGRVQIVVGGRSANSASDWFSAGPTRNRSMYSRSPGVRVDVNSSIIVASCQSETRSSSSRLRPPLISWERRRRSERVYRKISMRARPMRKLSKPESRSASYVPSRRWLSFHRAYQTREAISSIS